MREAAMKTVIALVLAAACLAAPGSVLSPPVPGYLWGETLRGAYPAQVAAGAYRLSGDVQIAEPGDTVGGVYAAYANSVGITRSGTPAPSGPYRVYLPDVVR
jgi:hypothetical protein